MALPLRFEALDGRLALLVPDAVTGADATAVAAAEAR
jgi:hypothetical protein